MLVHVLQHLPPSCREIAVSLQPLSGYTPPNEEIQWHLVNEVLTQHDGIISMNCEVRAMFIPQKTSCEVFQRVQLL